MQHILNDHWDCGSGGEVDGVFIDLGVSHVTGLEEVKHSSKVTSRKIEQGVLPRLRGIHFLNLHRVAVNNGRN